MRRARTYLSGHNGNGKMITAMNASDTHLRGWTAGVEVRTAHADDTDRFAIYMTQGSNGESEGAPKVLVGYVRHTASGPVWEPESATAGTLDRLIHDGGEDLTGSVRR